MGRQRTVSILFLFPKDTYLWHLCFLLSLGLLIWPCSSVALAYTSKQSIIDHYLSQHTSRTHTLHEEELARPKQMYRDPRPAPQLIPVTPLPVSQYQTNANLPGSTNPIYYGNPRLPEIALSFDDGPNPPYTSQILAILQRYSIKATFFTIGRQVQLYPALVRQELANGNTVGNHSWSHPSLPGLSIQRIQQELTRTSTILTQVTGIRPTYFRPPYGAFNATVLAQANALGLTTFIWNVDPQDWSIPGTNVIVSRVFSQVHNGSIILMHDGSTTGNNDRSQTVAALPLIITGLQKSGYRFVSLQQLVTDINQGTPTATPKPSTPHTIGRTFVSSSEIWKRQTSRSVIPIVT